MKILDMIKDTLKGLVPLSAPKLTEQDNTRRITLPSLWIPESGYDIGDKIPTYAIGRYLVIPPKDNGNDN